MLAAAVTRTTTHTTTMTFTVSGAETSTMYQTLSYLSEIQTLAWTTYTTTGLVNMPVWVTALRTALITSMSGYGYITSITRVVVTTFFYTTRIGGATIRATMRNTYTTVARVAVQIHTTVTVPTVVTTRVLSYVPVEVRGTVVTNIPVDLLTTVYSVNAVTMTFTEGGPVTVTRTDVLTYEVDEQSTPVPRPITDNLLPIVALVAAAIAVVGFMMLRRTRMRGPESPKIVEAVRLASTAASTGFCISCGTAFPEGAEFCPKCGERRTST